MNPSKLAWMGFFSIKEFRSEDSLQQVNLSLRFPVSLESTPMLHNYLENKCYVDVTVSHPHSTCTDNLTARMLSSLPYSLILQAIGDHLFYRTRESVSC